MIFLSISLLFIVGGVALTAGLWHIAKTQGALYVVFAGAFVIALAFFIRGIYFAVMKVSQVDGPL